MTEMTTAGAPGSGLTYSDGIAAARTMLALEGNAAALQRRLPGGWELAPYAGDDLRGTALRGANLLVPFHEVYAASKLCNSTLQVCDVVAVSRWAAGP
jgi:hypothetical protein